MHRNVVMTRLCISEHKPVPCLHVLRNSSNQIVCLVQAKDWYRHSQLCITSFLSVRELLEIGLVMSVFLNLKLSRTAATLWTQRSVPVLTLIPWQVEKCCRACHSPLRIR